jgi:DNA repair exonuclease SbcCD ATPase subunit
MAFDKETIKGILENAETTGEDKLKLIFSEHEADVRGLVDNRDKIKSEKEELEKQIKDAGKKIDDHAAKFAEAENRAKQLEEELKKQDPEARQKYFDNQIASIKNEYDSKLKESEEKRSFYEKSHFDHLREKAIAEALTDIPVDDRFKAGFVSLVLTRNAFEPVDVNNDGNIKFLDKNKKELRDVFHAISITDEGRNYLRPTSSGGGAPGSHVVRPKNSNPWSKDTLNLTEQGRIFKENPALAAQLKSEAGVA